MSIISYSPIQAISPSMCQYSARCLVVRDFSALKEGVIEYTFSSPKMSDSRYSCALWDRYALSSKYLSSKSVEPPSQALEMMMGGVTSKNSLFLNHSRAAL